MKIKIGNTTVDKEVFMTWLEALWSGNYSQTTKTLQDEKGYCCLGVACDLFIPKEKQILDDDGFLEGYYPKHQVYVLKWLNNINEDFWELTEFTLTDLNDTEGLSFNEIADVLYAVYVLKVLK